MIFLELVIQNFGPYCGRQVLDLRPDDGDSPPIILLGGMNGGGKTTLMDAVRLALYGHRAQCSTRNNLGYSEFLNQSVNRYTPPGDQTRIELTFEHILNNIPVEFKIARVWTKNSKNGKDTLGVFIDSREDSALTQIWDERIEDLLPLGISNLFLFDGEQVKELAEQEAPTVDVTNAIKTLLGLELAERLANDIDILVNRKRKALADTKDLASLEIIEQKLTLQKDKYEAEKEQLKIAQKDIETTQKHHDETSAKFLSEGGKIAKNRSQLETQLTYGHDAIANQRKNLVEIAADVLPLALISPLLTQAQTQAQKESKHLQAKIAQGVLKARDNRFLSCIENLALSQEQIEQINLFIEQENKALEQDINLTEPPYLRVAPEIGSQLNNIIERYLPSQINKAQEQLLNLKNKEEELTAIERQLAAAAPPETYEKLADAVKVSQAQLVQAKSNYETTKKHCEELGRLVDKTIKELSQFGEQNIDRKNDEHIIKASVKVQNTLKLFREKLTLRKLNQLETVVTECFLYLLHKSDLVHRIAIDASTFTLSLYDYAGKSVPKHRLSAGEKQLLAIAFLWGLARVSGRNLPVAIDTPLGRLDSSHRSNLIERYFPNASHQVILLSTDTEIGQSEVQQLRDNKAIAREYLLKYSTSNRQTTIEPGYFSNGRTAPNSNPTVSNC